MKGNAILAVVVSLCAMGEAAHAAFSLHGVGAGVVSTEGGALSHTPVQHEGHGAFRRSPADLIERQRRLEGAELLVDLAYESVVVRGSGKAHVVEGFADDVPFPTAMSMILPKGWQVYRDPSLNSRSIPDRVTFLGDVEWPEVLRQLGDRYAVQFHVDWYDRVVVMKPGRLGLIGNAERIRIIPEPVIPEPPAPLADSATTDEAVEVANADSLESDSDATAVFDADGNPVSAEAVDVAPEPAEPPMHTMLVLKGTLLDNVKRLSELNGWNPPTWDIDADFRIQTDYTIQAPTFPEAMAKLLLLHPIEADVNVGQRKIYVLKEVR
jgi:hypothetical protein